MSVLSVNRARRSAFRWPPIGVPYATLTFLLAVLLWQAISSLFSVPVYILPSPLAIIRDIVQHAPMLWSNSWITISEILLGFVISVLVGIPLAICVTYSPILDRAFYPLIVGSQTVPKVAIAPILLTWFGYGLAPKVTIVVLVAFFPIMINSVVGFRSAPLQMLHLAKSMGANGIQTFWRFRLPYALPSIFAGMKLATVLAVIGAVVAEFVGADAGLGYAIMVAGSNFDIPGQFAAIFFLSLIGTIFFAALSWTEKFCLPWHVSVRSTRGE